jgi:hypothetical protein
MKICMDFGPYDAFLSSDVAEKVNQQNSWNSLVISTYLLYLESNIGMLVVNLCILWLPRLTSPISSTTHFSLQFHLSLPRVTHHQAPTHRCFGPSSPAHSRHSGSRGIPRWGLLRPPSSFRCSHSELWTTAAPASPYSSELRPLLCPWSTVTLQFCNLAPTNLKSHIFLTVTLF